jgi:hypothetical protein
VSAMDERNYYLFDNAITHEEALSIYIDKIKKDNRYINEIDETLITVEEDYNVYYFFDADIIDHSYYYIDKENNIKVDGKIDLYNNKSDPLFLLNNLSKYDSNAKLDDFNNYIYEEKYKEALGLFLEELKDKAITTICKKHNNQPSKYVHIDIDLISGFTNYKLDVYIEKVYIFRYRSTVSKKDFISILSSVSKEFYSFEFIYNNEFNKYLKLYKRPLSYIPKTFIDYYYMDGFNTYVNVNKKLEFETYKSILAKIKENIEYEDYTPYNEYLYAGIFYFKISSYLKKMNTDNNELKKKIYLAYLTLNYQASSGLFLYECATLGLLEDNSVNYKIKLLNYSYKLKNLMAKKLLYEHYKNPRYYDERLLKKYS